MKTKYIANSVVLAGLLLTGCGDVKNETKEIKQPQKIKALSRAYAENWNPNVEVKIVGDSINTTFNKNIPNDIKHTHYYIDIDNDTNTGFSGWYISGADYMIEDQYIYKTKSNSEWDWEYIGAFDSFENLNKKIAMKSPDFNFNSIFGQNDFKLMINFYSETWENNYPTISNIWVDVDGINPPNEEQGNLLTNGDFTNNDGWIKNVNNSWKISNGQAVLSGSNSSWAMFTNDSQTLKAGKTYKIKFDIIECSNFGNVGFLVEANHPNIVDYTDLYFSAMGINTTGTHSITLTMTDSNYPLTLIGAGENTSAVLDNISVVEVQNGDNNGEVTRVYKLDGYYAMGSPSHSTKLKFIDIIGNYGFSLYYDYGMPSYVSGNLDILTLDNEGNYVSKSKRYMFGRHIPLDAVTTTDYLYIFADNGWGAKELVIIDVTDKTNPVKIAKLGVVGKENLSNISMKKDGNIISINYDVENGTNVTKKYDVSDPNNPISLNLIKVTREKLIEMIRNNEDYSKIDASEITDMSYLFNHREVKYDITSWDVSNVIDMRGLFQYTTNFNQNISTWDVSKVENMSNMFEEAEIFNQDISSWNVSKVRHTSNMFNFAYKFNQPLNNWDVSNVYDMSDMFNNAHEFNQPLNNWDVSNVENMSSMFVNAKIFNQDISNWDVSNIYDHSSFSYGCPILGTNYEPNF